MGKEIRQAYLHGHYDDGKGNLTPAGSTGLATDIAETFSATHDALERLSGGREKNVAITQLQIAFAVAMFALNAEADVHGDPTPPAVINSKEFTQADIDRAVADALASYAVSAATPTDGDVATPGESLPDDAPQPAIVTSEDAP